jgi:hypothetical protein
MDFFEGVFDPQFQVSSVHRKKFILPSTKLRKFKECLSKNIHFSPRVRKYLKAVHLIDQEKNTKKLEQTYKLHEKEHPGCSILPNIRNEITRRIKGFSNEQSFSMSKPLKIRSITSKTPDPRVTLMNTLNVSRVQVGISKL